jgi:hypothetical protein
MFRLLARISRQGILKGEPICCSRWWRTAAGLIFLRQSEDTTICGGGLGHVDHAQRGRIVLEANPNIVFGW